MAEHNGSDTFCFNRSFFTVVLILILVGIGIMIGKNVNQQKVTTKSEASVIMSCRGNQTKMLAGRCSSSVGLRINSFTDNGIGYDCCILNSRCPIGETHMRVLIRNSCSGFVSGKAVVNGRDGYCCNPGTKTYLSCPTSTTKENVRCPGRQVGMLTGGQGYCCKKITSIVPTVTPTLIPSPTLTPSPTPIELSDVGAAIASNQSTCDVFNAGLSNINGHDYRYGGVWNGKVDSNGPVYDCYKIGGSFNLPYECRYDTNGEALPFEEQIKCEAKEVYGGSLSESYKDCSVVSEYVQNSQICPPLGCVNKKISATSAEYSNCLKSEMICPSADDTAILTSLVGSVINGSATNDTWSELSSYYQRYNTRLTDNACVLARATLRGYVAGEFINTVENEYCAYKSVSNKFCSCVESKGTNVYNCGGTPVYRGAIDYWIEGNYGHEVVR